MALWTHRGYCPSAALTRHHVFGAFREVCRRASALASPRPVHFDTPRAGCLRGSVCRCHAALLSRPNNQGCFTGRRKKIRKLTVAVGVPAAWDGAHSDERLGRNDQWLAGRCPLFRPLLTILYAHQRSTSDYSTVSLARWTGCVRARCVAARLGSDEPSCMLCCSSAHDACVR
jgi:hypothetical protein